MARARHTALGSRARWSFVFLRGDGRPAWSIEIGSGLLRTMQALAPALFALGMWGGWLLQGQYGVRGAQKLALTEAHAAGHWIHFSSAGEPVPTEHIRKLQRRAAMVYAVRLGLGNVRAAGKLMAGIVQQAWADAANRGHTGDGTLLWPVPTGWYVRGYGSGEGGYHLAVDIAGPRGTNVVAVAPGVVGYAGSGVRGYGNIIVLIHPGARVSVYAHNQRHFVVPGQRVARGEPIAELGSTGISRGPHVHFEFIHDGKNCDPLPLFRPGIRHRAGHLSPVDQVLWPLDAARPRDVRCARRRRHPHSRWHHADEPDMSEVQGTGEAAEEMPELEIPPPPSTALTGTVAAR